MTLGLTVTLMQNHVIRRVDSSTGDVSTLAGCVQDCGAKAGYADGPGSLAKFNVPMSVAFAPDDAWLVVADRDNHVIRKVDLGTLRVSTLAGLQARPAGILWRDGISSEAVFNSPNGVSIDPMPVSQHPKCAKPKCAKHARSTTYICNMQLS
jgi:hypothetical protein